MSVALATGVLDQLRSAGVTPDGITSDSRQVRAGTLFAAWPGKIADGRRFIMDAVARGACGVVWDNTDGFRAESLPVPGVGVERLKDAAGFLAHEIYDRPSSAIWMAGVTGTNGKTTVSQWLAGALGVLGVRCGLIGTLGCGFPGALSASINTTPDALDVHRMLAGFRAEGATAAAIEVSSIGLDQGRVNGVEFDVALFTNLTRDHLDYHGSMDAYAAAKAKLFDMPSLRHAVINLDDAFGVTQARRLRPAGPEVTGYTVVPSNADALDGDRVLEAVNPRATATGTSFLVRFGSQTAELRMKAVAAFNISNALAVIGALIARAVPLADAVAAVSTLSPPEGRMQMIGGIGEPLVVVDYAHTPDALAKVLEAVRDTAAAREGRLVTVFGCGGDRDPGKRPLMGEVASRFADRVIVTSDNPRGEDPRAIADQVLAGAGAGAECIVDRAQAIRVAVSEAALDDVIVVAGKGHEIYQDAGGERTPFSDAAHAAAALRDRAGVGGAAT